MHDSNDKNDGEDANEDNYIVKDGHQDMEMNLINTMTIQTA